MKQGAERTCRKAVSLDRTWLCICPSHASFKVTLSLFYGRALHPQGAPFPPVRLPTTRIPALWVSVAGDRVLHHVLSEALWFVLYIYYIKLDGCMVHTSLYKYALMISEHMRRCSAFLIMKHFLWSVLFFLIKLTKIKTFLHALHWWRPSMLPPKTDRASLKGDLRWTGVTSAKWWGRQLQMLVHPQKRQQNREKWSETTSSEHWEIVECLQQPRKRLIKKKATQKW